VHVFSTSGIEGVNRFWARQCPVDKQCMESSVLPLQELPRPQPIGRNAWTPPDHGLKVVRVLLVEPRVPGN
jgi:hypothetical protein